MMFVTRTNYVFVIYLIHVQLVHMIKSCKSNTCFVASSKCIEMRIINMGDLFSIVTEPPSNPNRI